MLTRPDLGIADDPIPTWLIPIVVGCANEGVPIAAIARVVKFPFDDVMTTLRDAKDSGQIVSLPAPDWPATAKLQDRVPVVRQSQQDDDFAFQCRQHFKLTALEAGFLVALLKHERVEKHKLHNIVEQHRMTRATQPNSRDATDPKMVDVMICKLRKKLKLVDASFVIATIWGGGYHVDPAVKQKITEHMSHAQAATPAVEGALSLPG